MRSPLVSNVLGIIGGLIGGVLGYQIFLWIAQQGFYGLMIPGALLGLGCSLFARHLSLVRGLACGLAALALGLFSEWRFRPFVADKSFTYLVTHIADLQHVTLLMIAVGGFFGFWLGKDASPILGRLEPSQAKSETGSSLE